MNTYLAALCFVLSCLSCKRHDCPTPSRLDPDAASKALESDGQLDSINAWFMLFEREHDGSVRLAWETGHSTAGAVGDHKLYSTRDFSLFFEEGAQGVLVVSYFIDGNSAFSGQLKVDYLPVYDGFLDFRFSGSNIRIPIEKIHSHKFVREPTHKNQ